MASHLARETGRIAESEVAANLEAAIPHFELQLPSPGRLPGSLL
jgi:hypothetical protein